MAYVPTHTADDMSAITIDGMAGVLYGMVAFSSIVSLIILYRWFRGKPIV